ncbi:MAG TPA: hypothetical protein VMS56_04845 [Thermoanaerobaculia bacterium]|nr:hypothetical protein [Thermoanaerobaculia bacterium]
MIEPSAIDASNLLPHRRGARLLTEILRSGPELIEAAGVVPATHPLAGAAGAPCFIGLELGAQAAAALEVLLRIESGGDGSVRPGRLVRVREAEFLEPALPVDTRLTVTARLEGAAPPLSIYRIVVEDGRIEYLRAAIGTWGGTGPPSGADHSPGPP